MQNQWRLGMAGFGATALAAMLTVTQISSHAQDEKAENSATARASRSTGSRAAIQKALAPFNALIGGWRGSGQVRRGSISGAWRETGTFVWKFSGGETGIEYLVKDGKHLSQGLVSWDPETEEFTMDAILPDKSKRTYRGTFEKKVLTLTSEPDRDEMVSRITMRQLNEKRMLVLFEKRRADQSFYARVGEVGYTREGTRLASSDSSGPECIVTGGAGTIKVTHKDKTYYVCCTGCRDAFNDDPEGILADYRARLNEKRSGSK